MPEGGTLTIRVFAEKGCGIFGIGDTGIGMEPEICDKLFTPFFTTKEDGTGLGLVTSKKIVEAHNGHIHVDSQPNMGTQFYVNLPQ